MSDLFQLKNDFGEDMGIAYFHIGRIVAIQNGGGSGVTMMFYYQYKRYKTPFHPKRKIISKRFVCKGKVAHKI